MILLTIIHVLVCVFLVIVVLLQSGKAADLAGAFGGMDSQTAFGPRGAATVLSKATTIAAGLFMVTSLSLAILATKNAGAGSSVLERNKPGYQVGNGPGDHGSYPRSSCGSAADTWRACDRDARHTSCWSAVRHARLRQRKSEDGSARRQQAAQGRSEHAAGHHRLPRRRNRFCSSHGFAEVAELADALA